MTTRRRACRGQQARLQDRHHRRDRCHQRDLGENALPAGVVPVDQVADVFIDIQANTLLPNGKQAEKWEGLAIGPRLLGGARLILAGNDNDYSVTQTGAGEQFDVYVDFNGNVAKCVLDSTDASAKSIRPRTTP